MIKWRSQSDQETYNKLLIPVIRDRPTSVFVGAGLSVHAGYPLLYELINLLEAKAVDRNSKIVVSGDWKNKAQICQDELGNDYFQILIDRFNPDNNRSRFTSIHANLIQIRFQSFITTNYDSCIELAFRDLGINKVPIVYPNLMVSKLNNKSIQHIHGYIDPNDPHSSVGSVILTTRDFMEAYSDKLGSVKDFLVKLFSEQNVIFFGFNVSAKDDLWFKILESVKEIRGQRQRNASSRHLPPEPERIYLAILENRVEMTEDIYKDRGQEITKEIAEEMVRNQDDILRDMGVYPIRYNSDEFHKSVENIIVDMRILTRTLQPQGSEAGDLP